MSSLVFQKLTFFAGVLLCLFPFITPQVALVLGILLGITIGHPFPDQNRRSAKFLLQLSVIGVGFGINIHNVAQATVSGVVLAIGTIVTTLLLGLMAGRLFGVNRKTAHLISAGTAICGGSAIAAVAPVIDADEKGISVSLGTVFILNAVALFAFPILGRLLDLSQVQFGIWSAIAIHDTSSVVAAAARYGEEALLVATTVKLFRALWIVPLVVLSAILYKTQKVAFSFPYFILLFVVASLLSTYSDLVASYSNYLVKAAKIGMTVILFLIGSGISKSMMLSVSVRPLVQGVVLWMVVSVGTLISVLTFL